MFRRIFILLIVAALVAAGALFVWLRSTAPKAGALDVLQNGDLVFQTRISLSDMSVAFMTLSPLTHVGIIKNSANAAPRVVDVSDKVQEMPLSEWLEHGAGDRVVVKRMRGMTPAIAANILESARAYYGKPDDLLFRFDADSIYSGELVYAAFQSGARINLGRVQRMLELNVDNVFVQKFFAMHWRDHPLCRTPESNIYTVCADLILSQEIITPVSIATAPQLDTVYDNYGWLATLIGKH